MVHFTIHLLIRFRLVHVIKQAIQIFSHHPGYHHHDQTAPTASCNALSPLLNASVAIMLVY